MDRIELVVEDFVEVGHESNVSSIDGPAAVEVLNRPNNTHVVVRPEFDRSRSVTFFTRLLYPRYSLVLLLRHERRRRVVHPGTDVNDASAILDVV